MGGGEGRGEDVLVVVLTCELEMKWGLNFGCSSFLGGHVVQ